MDQIVINTLRQAGIDVTLRRSVPHLLIRMNDQMKAQPAQDEMMVEDGARRAMVTFQPLARLFTGNRQPPDQVNPASDSPYILFFALLEQTALSYCNCARVSEIDPEFERLYRQLRRRPDGTDRNPIFSYLRAASQLYLSLQPVSQAEFEAVAQRLSISARTFTTHATSRNYLAQLRSQFEGAPPPRPI